MSAKLDTVHNASVCKQPPNANRSVGFSPIKCPIQQKQHIILMRFFVGGDNRARTCDPVLVRHVLSQLSYTPNLW